MSAHLESESSAGGAVRRTRSSMPRWRRWGVDTSSSNGRMWIVGVILLLLLAVAMGRAFWLVRYDRPWLVRKGYWYTHRKVSVTPPRGTIYDASGGVVASSTLTESIVIETPLPNESDTEKKLQEVNDQRLAALGRLDELARVLHLDPAALRADVGNASTFRWIRHFVSPQLAKRVRDLKMEPLVGVREEYLRFYPQRDLAAQVLGGVSSDGKGLAGVESRYDALLQPVPSKRVVPTDKRGRGYLSDPEVDTSGTPGAALRLTIHPTIQGAADVALQQAVEKTHAKAAMLVAMDPHTGAILALSSAPVFDLNHPPAKDAESRRNRLVNDAYEPGSTMKSFVIAGALQDGLVTPDTPIEVGSGRMQIGRRSIGDSHAPRTSVETVTQVLVTSSNVGAARIGMRMSAARLTEWLRAFGFGSTTGIDLPAERSGVLQKTHLMGDIGRATTSFGQGMTATPIQIVTALSAIANGGKLMRPYVVASVEPAGAPPRPTQPQVVREVLRPEVARQVAEMMEGVTQKGGTGTQAAIPGIRVAGKTGTAQKVDVGTGRYGRKRFSSFMGFAPAEDPRVAIYVAIDEPQGDVYGGLVAAPVFNIVARAALRQFGINPPAGDPVIAPPDDAREGSASDDPVPDDIRQVSGDGDIGAVSTDASGATPKNRPAEATRATATPAAPGAPAIPSLLGVPVREALDRLTAAGLHPVVTGVGRIVAQDPPAGAAFPADGVVRLRLEVR